MQLKVKESIRLEDGKYIGQIVRIEYRTEPYKYTDVYIKESGSEMEIKYGCPTNLSTDSKLGLLLSQFTTLKVGELVDPDEILCDKQVTFMTLKEKGKDGKEYVRIVDGSIKPFVVEQEVK